MTILTEAKILYDLMNFDKYRVSANIKDIESYQNCDILRLKKADYIILTMDRHTYAF